jgi:iron complex outermembrane receptor protein
MLTYQGSRETPSSWRGSRANSVGLSALDASVRENRGEGPWTPENGMVFDAKEFDPQVTLRYRPTDNHSLFARWAQAFKAGGFDTGVTSINTSLEDLVFDPESAETWEVGSKGNLLDGRARYDVALFWTEFLDFQITVPTGDPDDPFLNVNAGKQRVRGAEFNTTMAVTDQLTLSLAGAFMDGEMVFFPAGGCTTEERVNFQESGCDPDTGRIDRSGQSAPRTPDWKFVLTMDYWMPVLDEYRLNFNAKGYVSDAYITDINGFGQTVMMNRHEDLNLTAGIGDQNDTWEFSVWGRNIFEARRSYNEEFDVLPSGLQSGSMSPSQFFSYGIKFRYNMR